MKILLEELPHQLDALKALDEAFLGIDENTTDKDANYTYANPIIKGRGQEKTNIDIKMETGTGKTYVGVRAMYELHQKYDLFKFIIVVPTPAIKEGWKNFISSDYAKQHFNQYYDNVHINLNVINNGDFKKQSGRQTMPSSLLDYVEGTRLNNNSIEVLLINAQMLNSKSLTKEFDQTLLSGFTKPLDAIIATRPIVIIDEPHRFPRDKKNYQAVEETNPQMIIRLGATFPDKKIGTGRKSKIVKDYYRGEPQYNLNAVQSFNQNLVKGIDIYFPMISMEEAKDIWKVDSVSPKLLTLKKGPTIREVAVGEDIGFDGDITYEGGKRLSNGLDIEKGMQFIPSTMTTNYQELIIRDAIDKHFETEQANFLRENMSGNNLPRVKTLSLFFIDSINSYRGDQGEAGWLKDMFERLLMQKLSKLVAEYENKFLPREQEYLDFLRATQADISASHAGYFGRDRGTSDEAIQAEIDDILTNKEKMLSFVDETGQWNTRRFLFSKWTLREGWDNPNVFVIAKLRTSGSENSKLQEVGRGLRLPVDETGHRLQQEEFPSRLSFLIGYDEKDFAKKLVGEINSDTDVHLDETKLDESTIKIILNAYPEFKDETALKNILGEEGIIDFSGNYKEDGFAKLKVLYPEVANTQLRPGKVATNGKNRPKTRIKLKKENWRDLKELWQQFSKRYMLRFDRLDLSVIIEEVFGDPNFYERTRPEQVHQQLTVNDEAEFHEQIAEYNTFMYLDGMPYGQFLKKLTLLTKISVKDLHHAILPVMKQLGSEQYLNDRTISNLTREWQTRFANKYAENYHYDVLEFSANTSVYDVNRDEFKDDVLAEVLGANVDNDSVSDSSRYLYDNPPLRFDSVHPERDLLTRGYDVKVTAFGKLPKRAIQVPKYTGGTTTPDFVYVIEREDAKNIYLLVETKAENMRDEDHRIESMQKKFFSMLKEHGVEYQLATDAHQVYKKISELGDS